MQALMINVFQPSLGEEEVEAVARVFADNWLGHGPRTKLFEEEFAAHIDVPAERLVFINSATSGLFLTAELLGLGPEDDVVLPSTSFVAASNAIASTGARPVFCDVDPRTLNPVVEQVESALTPRTKAVVLLHYGGYPGDVAAVAALCRERGIKLVEDAACAVASRADGTACGAFGDLAMWSFDSMKILVTGDGGMLYAREEALARKARLLAYHGLDQESGFTTAGRSQRWWEPNVRAFGRRVIGNDIAAAIGSVQLRRLPGFVERRREIAAMYDRLLAGCEGVALPPPLPAGHVTSHYFYWVQLDPSLRDLVAADMLEQGVYTTCRYPALHRVPAYRAYERELPGADAASDRTLLLPLHQGLADDDVRSVAAALRRAVERQAGARSQARGAGHRPTRP
ncbi:DegT/DnrJ/EryC1/StrS aminotransferase family protein [Streptomyces sp. ST2-7A]|uniref:DegT/DnrJ/EryC1/StrS family aminotransferase n=1 Tax=Streptomyces sp. ST2-7A TaxID=2907214 RepID=UPI001F2A4285|nr:DegT/DnrJ/EryC1/StrS family aminotransferase [Streptomyces sp. ST2-7A]MCE7082463.1 DegT/DnrJ/EryC1/StrS family aminotransferase [Streptomyces sp. ST2-7A]